MLLSLALMVAPRASPRLSASPAAPPLDAAVVMAVAAAAVAIAATIAWRLGPEGDEMVTPGTRHAMPSYLLSWADGGEPFNPPGPPAIFALWLRMATVSIDEITDGVVVSAAAFPRIIWIIDASGTHRIPAQLRACEQVQRDASWAVLECSNAAPRAD